MQPETSYGERFVHHISMHNSSLPDFERSLLDQLKRPSSEDFFDQMRLGLAFFSNENNFNYVSRSLANIIGSSPAELQSAGPAFLSQLIVQEDKPLVGSLLMKCERLLQKEVHTYSISRISFDYRITDAKGQIKRLCQHRLSSGVSPQGTPLHLLIVQDYTGVQTTRCLHYQVSCMQGNLFKIIAEGRERPTSPYSFTACEKKIIELSAGGKCIDQIAQLMHISRETVKRHRHNILKKTASPNMIALVNNGFQKGWLEVGY